MRTDGSERSDLLPRVTLYPYVSGDWVYYLEKSRDLSLWRMPAAGGDPLEAGRQQGLLLHHRRQQAVVPRGHGLNASADRLFVSVRPAATEDLFCREGVLVYSDFFEDNKLFRVDLNNWNVTKLDE